MLDKKNIQVNTVRLEQLKQATIVNFLAFIDLDDDIALYDTMIRLFAEGKLDGSFYSPFLDKMEASERNELLNLGNKYVSLCFFDGNPECWTDSVEGLSVDDYNLICMRIFDNYNFLLEIARDGGVDALEQLKTFQKSSVFADRIIIDYLRTIFNDDNLLKKCIIDVSRSDGDYKEIDGVMKAAMFLHPDGVLFVDEGEGKKRLSFADLMKKVEEKVSSNKSFSQKTLPSLSHSMKDYLFDDIITDIYMDYVLRDFNEDSSKTSDK